MARLGLFGGREHLIGPALGLGTVLLVTPEQGPVATPVALPGLHAHLAFGPTWFGLDAQLLMWAENSAPLGEQPELTLALTPQLSLSLGGRFRPRSSTPF
jgi:hypothetical protein